MSGLAVFGRAIAQVARAQMIAATIFDLSKETLPEVEISTEFDEYGYAFAALSIRADEDNPPHWKDPDAGAFTVELWRPNPGIDGSTKVVGRFADGDRYSNAVAAVDFMIFEHERWLKKARQFVTRERHRRASS